MVDNNRAAADKVVSIHYTLTSTDGNVLDSSGEQPLPYLHGHGNIVPGLEQEIEGKAPGDKFRAVVEPADGYGERRPDSQRTLPRDAFPETARLSPGAQFVAQEPDGQPVPLWVVSADEKHVLVDLDHPLAGETLTFDVEVVGVRDATEEEREHGHAHIPGAHHH